MNTLFGFLLCLFFWKEGTKLSNVLNERNLQQFGMVFLIGKDQLY